MKTERNISRLEGKKNENKISHAEFAGGAPRTFASSTHAVLQRPQHAWKTLKQVQGDFIINNRAFTLIELLVVVLIIGILASVALPQYNKAVVKARVTELQTLVKHVKEMQEVYYMENAKYAANCEELGISSLGGYTLNEDKLLENTSKHFTLDCERSVLSASNSGHNRVAGLFTPTNSDLLSLEYGLSLSEKEWARDRLWCFAEGEKFKPICRSLCGTDLMYDDGHSCFVR